jgi:four helix bundle protein
MDLCEAVYSVTRHYHPDERFGLVAQSRRSVVSVASNIAEGAGRPGRTDFARFLGYAIGSLSELETQIEIARRVEELADEHAEPIIDAMGRLGRRLVRLHHRVVESDRRLRAGLTDGR